MTEPTTMFAPETLVTYKGGGYDGCIWELNYAFIDAEGEFQNVYSSGCMGCDSLKKLEQADIDDTYDFSQRSERERFADSEPISRVMGVALVLSRELGYEPSIELVCDLCGQRFDAITARGCDVRCIGGIQMEYFAAVCGPCWENKYCHDCEVPLGEDGLCPYCKEDDK